MTPSTATRPARSLHLRRPFGAVPIGAFMLLATFVVVAELAASSTIGERWLPVPTLAGQPGFGVKLTRLERLVAERGPLDCLIVGPSAAATSLDPERVAKEYRSRKGRDLTCFNFGLGALTLPSAEDLLELLVPIAEPRWIVLATLPREERPGEPEVAIAENPWSRYRRGEMSLDGWLFEQSLGYRRFLGFRAWLEAPSFYAVEREKAALVTAYGFERHPGVNQDVSEAPDPERPSDRDVGFFRRFRSFEVSDRHVAALERILARFSPGRIVVVETPVHPTFLSFLPRGERDWNLVRETAAKVAERHRVPFLRWSGGAIPDKAWRDRNHLNEAGSVIASRWLGRRLARTTADGALHAGDRS